MSTKRVPFALTPKDIDSKNPEMETSSATMGVQTFVSKIAELEDTFKKGKEKSNEKK